MDAKDKELQFIAAELAREMRTPRWWCLDEPFRQKFLAQARAKVDAWFAAEKEVEERMKRECGF